MQPHDSQSSRENTTPSSHIPISLLPTSTPLTIPSDRKYSYFTFIHMQITDYNIANKTLFANLTYLNDWLQTWPNLNL